MNGEVEVDESYFGPKRARGKRGRGVGGKTIVFGLLKREGGVFASNSTKPQTNHYCLSREGGNLLLPVFH